MMRGMGQPLRNSGDRWVGKADSSTPEKLVLNALAHRGWQVVRNFWVFDPEAKAYGECDVVAVSGHGLVVVEVKRWEGDFMASDHTPYQRWKKMGSDEDKKSPVWQVCRARDLLLRLIQRDFMARPVDLAAATQTFVVLDPGRVVNARELDQARVWKDCRVEVCDVPGFISAMPAQPASQVPAEVWQNLVAYAEHFRMTPDLRKAEGEARVRKLESLQVLWETRRGK